MKYLVYYSCGSFENPRQYNEAEFRTLCTDPSYARVYTESPLAEPLDLEVMELEENVPHPMYRCSLHGCCWLSVVKVADDQVDSWIIPDQDKSKAISRAMDWYYGKMTPAGPIATKEELEQEYIKQIKSSEGLMLDPSWNPPLEPFNDM